MTEIATTTKAVRGFLYVAMVLVIGAGIQLFVLTEHTDRYFAWTIDLPITAAFLGANYWAAAVLEGMSARQRHWARARMAMPAVFVFTSTTLVVTLIHFDRFHMDSSFGWVWLFVYAVVPVVMVEAWRRQRRAGGADPPRHARLSPRLLPPVLQVTAALVGALGLYLLVRGARASRLWPWPLTSLTGRAVGAWLVAVGVLILHASLEDDWARLRPAAATAVVLAVLQAVTLLRYGDSIQWDRAAAWVYVGGLAVAGLGGAGALWRSGRPPAPPKRADTAAIE